MAAVTLIRIDAALADALAACPRQFEELFSVRLADCADRVADTVAQTRASEPAECHGTPWGGYLAADAATGRVVGTCGFTCVPAADGTIEIAYHTFPAYEGLGYATAMAERLVLLASMSPRIRRIVAHTPPERGVSTRILEGLGMQRRGTAEDAADGPVWRWELAPDATSHRTA